MADCSAYETGTLTHYKTWAEAPTTDPYRPECAPTCWENLEGTVECMEPTAPPALAITGADDVDPLTAIAGVVLIIAGLITLKLRRA